MGRVADSAILRTILENYCSPFTPICIPRFSLVCCPEMDSDEVLKLFFKHRKKLHVRHTTPAPLAVLLSSFGKMGSILGRCLLEEPNPTEMVSVFFVLIRLFSLCSKQSTGCTVAYGQVPPVSALLPARQNRIVEDVSLPQHVGCRHPYWKIF